MIVVDIIQNNEVLASEISKYLIDNQYALQTHIDKNMLFNNSNNLKTIRLFFITKALLFDAIYNDITKKFDSNDMVIYATPVSHISKEFGEKLRLNLRAA
jgi:hypothetical protein